MRMIPVLLVVTLLLSLALAAPLGAAANGWIQPGDRLRTSKGSCTLNFVFDGTGDLDGKVYIGSAAHCFAAVGDEAKDNGGVVFGRAVYLGDWADSVSSFDNGVPGNQLDFALIEVDPAFHHVVLAGVKGHQAAGPKGVATSEEARFGDLVQFSGYGTGFSTTSWTQERRVGVLRVDDARMWGAVGPVAPGDSGGPVLHVPTGKALGVATLLSVGTSGTARGPMLSGVLAELHDLGWTVDLRTI